MPRRPESKDPGTGPRARWHPSSRWKNFHPEHRQGPVAETRIPTLAHGHSAVPYYQNTHPCIVLATAAQDDKKLAELQTAICQTSASRISISPHARAPHARPRLLTTARPATLPIARQLACIEPGDKRPYFVLSIALDGNMSSAFPTDRCAPTYARSIFYCAVTTPLAVQFLIFQASVPSLIPRFS